MKYSEASGKNKTPWRASEMAFALLATVIVSACNSSDGGLFEKGSEGDIQTPPISGDSGTESLIVTGIDGSNSDATSGWLVNAFTFKLNSRLDSTGDATVNLVRYSDDFPVYNHVEFFTEALEICEVTDPDAPPTPGDDEDEGGNQAPRISGGPTVVINTPSGPWFTLNRTSEEGQPTYTIDNGLPAELLPAGANLSIPGDEFPTVAAHPLYDPVPPERLLPDADVPVSAESAYAWIPHDGKTYMRITLLAYNQDNSFVDFAASCVVRDDGSFTMPAEVINFVSTTPYRLRARYARVYNRLDFVNGIVIRQRNVVAE